MGALLQLWLGFVDSVQGGDTVNRKPHLTSTEIDAN